MEYKRRLSLMQQITASNTTRDHKRELRSIKAAKQGFTRLPAITERRPSHTALIKVSMW